MWVQVLFILAKYKKYYDMAQDIHYALIFVTTFGIAASMTASAIYLIFYPLGKEIKENLEKINFMFILIMAYTLLFTLIGSEWFDRQPLVFYFLFATLFLLIACLVLI